MTSADEGFSCFTCPRCQCRVNRGDAEPGAKVKCPTCGLELIVPRPPSPDDGAGQGGTDDEYAIRVEPTPPRPVEPYVPGRDHRNPQVVAAMAAKVERREESAWEVVRHAPPSGLFFVGTFSFPFHPSAQSHSLTLVIGAIVAAAPLAIGLWTFGAADAGLFVGFGATVSSVLLVALGAALSVTWAVMASIYGLTVLRETSYGCQSIDKWPVAYSLDSLTESLYVLASAGIGVLPGLVAAPLWDWLGWPKMLMAGASLMLLFPLFLLSMLETNSPMMPVSPPVWGSVFRAWRAWGLFYLITLMGMAVFCLLLGLGLRFGGRLSLIVVGVLLSVAWMIYFRLLGRLAWFCSGNPADEPPERD